MKFSIINNCKYCSKCDKSVSISSFNPNPKIKSGLSSWCSNCVLTYNRNRYIPNGKPRGRPIKYKESVYTLPKPIIAKGFRECTKCSIIKEKTDLFFNKDPRRPSGLSTDCKECRFKYQKEQRLRDPEKYNEIQRRSAQKHMKKRKKYRKLYAKTHRDSINANVRRKRKENPMYRVAENLRRAVGGCIERNSFRKSSKLNEYLGCNSQEFKVYLESLFQPGMAWDNYGFGNDKWNIDHRVPLASAKTVEDLYRLSHYSNLQPMWQPENFAKGDKMPDNAYTVLAVNGEIKNT
jgi:hypothetical protein